jgi:hypothetical protein
MRFGFFLISIACLKKLVVGGKRLVIVLLPTTNLYKAKETVSPQEQSLSFCRFIRRLKHCRRPVGFLSGD